MVSDDSSVSVNIHPDCVEDPSSCQLVADVEVQAEAEVENEGDEASEEDVAEIGSGFAKHYCWKIYKKTYKIVST